MLKDKYIKFISSYVKEGKGDQKAEEFKKNLESSVFSKRPEFYGISGVDKTDEQYQRRIEYISSQIERIRMEKSASEKDTRQSSSIVNSSLFQKPYSVSFDLTESENPKELGSEYARLLVNYIRKKMSATKETPREIKEQLKNDYFSNAALYGSESEIKTSEQLKSRIKTLQGLSNDIKQVKSNILPENSVTFRSPSGSISMSQNQLPTYSELYKQRKYNTDNRKELLNDSRSNSEIEPVEKNQFGKKNSNPTMNEYLQSLMKSLDGIVEAQVSNTNSGVDGKILSRREKLSLEIKGLKQLIRSEKNEGEKVDNNMIFNHSTIKLSGERKEQKDTNYGPAALYVYEGDDDHISKRSPKNNFGGEEKSSEILTESGSKRVRFSDKNFLEGSICEINGSPKHTPVLRNNKKGRSF